MKKNFNRFPVSNVAWLLASDLFANDYNPNKMSSPERNLLITSIIDDGWVLPIIIKEGGEIVDGFHRWHLCKTVDEINELTNGYVPTVTLPPANDKAHQIMSTIRYNRARGVHTAAAMAGIVNLLLGLGETEETVAIKLGMEDEEVTRLKEYGKMTLRGSSDDFNKGWVPGA